MSGSRHTEESLKRVSHRVAEIYGELAQCDMPTATASLDGDLVSVVMHNSLSASERMLVSAGSGDGVRQLRLEVQDGMRDRMIAVVEAEIGRPVLACMNANHIDPDIALATFLLDGHGVPHA